MTACLVYHSVRLSTQTAISITHKKEYKMKKCVECNTDIDDGANVCSKCGGDTFISSYSADDVSSLFDSMMNRGDAKKHVDRGAHFFEEGHYDEAISEYKIAIEINPLNATAHSNIRGALLKQEKTKEAIPWLEKALEINPDLEGVTEALIEANTISSGSFAANINTSNTEHNRTRPALVALVLGVVYSLFELLVIREIIPWNEVHPFLFFLIITPCAFISIKYKYPNLLIGAFAILVALDFYYIVLSLNENIYLEIVTYVMYPESFPYVHTIIVLISSFFLMYFTYKKTTTTGITFDQAQHGAMPGNTKNSLFTFDGRIRRSTFWAVIAPLFLISFGLQIAIAVSAESGSVTVVAVIALIYFIPAIWVALATYVKRWHDLNKSGWMVLAMFIPLVNILVLLYLGIAPGTVGANKFGNEPQ